MDCAKALAEFKGTALEEACERLCTFDLYHLLFKPAMSASIKTAERFKYAPEDYLKWSRFCGGGDLQICEFLGEKGIDKNSGIRYASFDEYEMEGKEAGVPEEYHIFAVANFGDFYCFHNPGDGKRDACVYQWGVHESEIVLVWDSFSDWLCEQVNTWVDMIADDELDPIGYKLEDDHE